jgi:hypothetical protein
MGLFTKRRPPAADPWTWQPVSAEVLTADSVQFDEQGAAASTAWGAVFGLAEVPAARIVIWSYAIYAPPDLGGYQIGMAAQYLLGEEELTTVYDYDADDYYDLSDCEDGCRENAELLAGLPRLGPSVDDLMFFDWDGEPF